MTTTLHNSARPSIGLNAPVTSMPLVDTGIDKHIPIIVFSHLRWDWVWQRPQQFLSRLSEKHRVLFVEYPPLPSAVPAPTYRLRTAEPHSNIQILQIHIPQDVDLPQDMADKVRLDLVQQAIKAMPGKFEKPLLWFYDPMASATYLGQMDESVVVYDCMDQLSQFRFAPPELTARERKLLKAADIVFTGGRKMWEDKRRYHDNCHFYGCGVDVKHFGAAREESTVVPEDVATLSGPIMGYFGVVDERLDYDLIARLADENSAWNVVIVGPSCKVDPAEFPRRSNLHWLGGREYTDLPGYCRAFDVCLMPFALNEATEFINPTKALEYMATGTPIVSTSVPDVVSNFGDVVAIANSPDEFIGLCRDAITNPDPATLERGLRMAEANTWEIIVSSLDQHIQDVLCKRAAKSNNLARPVASQASRAVAPIMVPQTA